MILIIIIVSKQIEKGIDLPGDILDADECVEALSKIMEVSR